MRFIAWQSKRNEGIGSMKHTTGKESVKSKIVSSAWKLFYDKGYNGTTVDDIIEMSGTSKGSFYYYFKTKDELLNTLSIILDERYEELEQEMEESQDSFEKLMYINYEAHSLMEQKISIDLIASLYSTQLVAQGNRHLLDQNRSYYKLVTKIVEDGQRKNEITMDMPVRDIVQYYSVCERALVSDWCLHKGEFSLAEASRLWMPIMMEHFRVKK